MIQCEFCPYETRSWTQRQRKEQKPVKAEVEMHITLPSNRQPKAKGFRKGWTLQMA